MLSGLRSLAAVLTPPSPVSKGILYVAGFLLLLNIRSFPLSWHYGVMLHPLRLRLRYLLFRLTLVGKKKEERTRARQMWLEGLAPVGSDPWAVQLKASKWAGPDDCDFYLHLSNSSYAKVLDEVRMNTALVYFPSIFRAGCWLALGATHYTFHREISMFASYEMRVNIASWDDKWIYIITRYVTLPKNKKQQKNKDTSTVPSKDSAPVPNLHTPALESSTPMRTNPASSPAALKALAESSLRKTEPDGAILNCINVSEVCVKNGRITVPPAIVFALNGFTVPSSVPGTPYSHKNPPPHMEKARELLADPQEAKAFVCGGWRDVPEEERWWEQALGGVIEEKRKVTLELVQDIRQGMAGAKAVY